MPKDKDHLKWYQGGLEVLGPLRYHIHQLIKEIESHNRFVASMKKLGVDVAPACRPDYLKEAKKASEKAEAFFVPKKG